jgi:hypothetical protein
MRLTTILTLPGATLSEKGRRIRDWVAQKVAGILPRRVRYWSTIGDLAKATTASANVPATPLDEVMRNLPAPKVVS